LPETSNIENFLSLLGVGDRDSLPLIMSDEFASLTSSWRVARCGRRGVDHVGRDLLFGSLGRDYRARLYKPAETQAAGLDR
jgi:hypothetical protein